MDLPPLAQDALFGVCSFIVTTVSGGLLLCLYAKLRKTPEAPMIEMEAYDVEQAKRKASVESTNLLLPPEYEGPNAFLADSRTPLGCRVPCAGEHAGSCRASL